MTQSLLDYFLITQLSAALLIFCRIGAGLMAMPAFGEVYVSVRIRLLLALVLTVMLTPLLTPRMPALPASGLGLMVLIIGEVLVGAFIGLIARTILMAVHAAGNIIAVQSSLAVASIFDPMTLSQSAVVSNLLSLVAITLFFALNLHHLLLAALIQSYDVFTPGIFPSASDMNMLYVRMLADSFKLGLLLSAPHIVMSLLFYLAGGLMTRLMPNFQIFFVMMSPQILLALFLLFAILPLMMEVFTTYMNAQLSNFVVGI